jgi:hypothetical protein
MPDAVKKESSFVIVTALVRAENASGLCVPEKAHSTCTGNGKSNWWDTLLATDAPVETWSIALTK